MTRSRTRAAQCEGNAGTEAGFGAFEGEAAFEPEEFLEDEADLGRGAEGVEEAEVLALGREMDVAEGGGAIGELVALAEMSGEHVFERGQPVEDAMEEGAEGAGGDVAGGFIDGNDAAGVKSGVVAALLAEQLELGVQDEEIAGVGVEFDFAVEGEARAFDEAFGEIAAVEPFAAQAGAGAVGEDGFEEAEIFAVKAGEFGGFDLGDDGGHFAGSEEGDGLQVAAVLITERRVGEEVLDGAKAFGFEDGGAGGADAFDELERRGEVEGQGYSTVTLLARLRGWSTSQPRRTAM